MDLEQAQNHHRHSTHWNEKKSIHYKNTNKAKTVTTRIGEIGSYQSNRTVEKNGKSSITAASPHDEEGTVPARRTLSTTLATFLSSLQTSTLRHRWYISRLPPRVQFSDRPHVLRCRWKMYQPQSVRFFNTPSGRVGFIISPSLSQRIEEAREVCQRPGRVGGRFCNMPGYNSITARFSLKQPPFSVLAVRLLYR